MLFTTSTKTQYAGPDVYIALIKLLKHVAAQYLTDSPLVMKDFIGKPAMKRFLLNQFKKYDAAIDSFRKSLEGLSSVPGKAPESCR